MHLCRFLDVESPPFSLLVTLATSRPRPSIWTSWADEACPRLLHSSVDPKSARPRHLQDSTGTIAHATHQKILPQQLISCSQRQKCHTVTALIAIIVWAKDVDISVWQRLTASGVLFTIYLHNLHVYDNDDDDDEVRWSGLSINNSSNDDTQRATRKCKFIHDDYYNVRNYSATLLLWSRLKTSCTKLSTRTE